MFFLTAKEGVSTLFFEPSMSEALNVLVFEPLGGISLLYSDSHG